MVKLQDGKVNSGMSLDINMQAVFRLLEDLFVGSLARLFPVKPHKHVLITSTYIYLLGCLLLKVPFLAMVTVVAVMNLCTCIFYYSRALVSAGWNQIKAEPQEKSSVHVCMQHHVRFHFYFRKSLTCWQQRREGERRMSLQLQQLTQRKYNSQRQSMGFKDSWSSRFSLPFKIRVKLHLELCFLFN